MQQILDEYPAWFEKHLLGRISPHRQMTKVMEEVGELAAALFRAQPEKLEDAIGDVFITLMGMSRVLNLDFRECVTRAWNEVKDRSTNRILMG